jgi:phenylalanyl-tRNA synthetase beta chain
MKILKTWLEDYVNINQTDQQLDDMLTFSGTLVEDISRGLDPRIIVVRILEIKPHPNADKLRLVRVTDANKNYDIVCGADNIKEGQIVPLATIGAKLNDIEIQEALIRGEKSLGMLCSQKELGLGDNHEGIYILPNEYVLGESLCKYLNSDSVFELEITPNRGDCLSHLGIAREVAALTNQKIKFDDKISTDTKNKPSNKLKIEISDLDHCFAYGATVIRSVKIAPSPDWLAKRLIAVGIKPINNIVDITNYIMMDLGQPLHAFDKSKILNDKIIVRLAKDGEKITTIDAVERTLDDQMIVISDEKKPLAIAGVMGGADSAISDNTSEIILESAVFERRSVRRTAKLLRLTTDASYRFERGIDGELTVTAMRKAAKMICDIAGGEIIDETIDIAVENKNDFVKIENDKINELLGTKLENFKIDEYLKSLGFYIKDEMAQAPSWRHDIFVWQDLAEEVARLVGFENIPVSQMAVETAPKNSDYYYKEYLKDVLVENGFCEVFTYPFLSESDLKSLALKQEELLEVANPIQKENKYMRNSLAVGLVRAVAKNPTFDPILIFEFGNVLSVSEEKTHLAILSSGKSAKAEIAKCVEAICQAIGADKNIFKIQEFSRDDLTRYKVKKSNVFVCELDCAILIEVMRKNKISADFNLSDRVVKYREVSKYPPINRDLSFVVDKDCIADDVVDVIYETSASVLMVELFDEFVSDKFGENRKSVAFHIYLQDTQKTLSDNEADEQISKIVNMVSSKFDAKLRD